MEISSSVISKSMPSCYYDSGVGGDIQTGKSTSRVSGVRFPAGNRIPSLKGGLKMRRNWDFCGFAEKGHMDYYRDSPVFGEKKGKIKGKKGWDEVSMKKKKKLVKGLVKDLEEFSQLGFGLQVDCHQGLVGQDDESKKISGFELSFWPANNLWDRSEAWSLELGLTLVHVACVQHRCPVLVSDLGCSINKELHTCMSLYTLGYRVSEMDT